MQTYRLRSRKWLCFGALLTAGGMSATVSPAVRALPDGRGYELVSPSAKNGADVLAMSRRTRASAHGNAIEFSSLTGFGDVQGVFVVSEYVSRRDDRPGTSGWTTHAITPPQQSSLSFPDSTLNALQPRYVGEFSKDLSKGVFLAKTPLSTNGANVADVPNIYLRNDILQPGVGTYQLVSDCPLCVAPLPGNAPLLQPGLASASDDFEHVLFESTFNLAVGAHGTLPKLYEWDHGAVQLVGILPDNTPAPTSAAGSGIGAVGNADLVPQQDAMSRDGSRIYFTAPIGEDSRCDGACDLYMRDTHGTVTTADDETIQLNADGGNTLSPAIFQGATPGVDAEGARVPAKILFTAGSHLYQYDTSLPDGASDNITDISGSVSAVIGISDDGGYIYFISEEQLAPGNPEVCDALTPCIFLWHNGSIRLVAKINTAEVEFLSRQARLILAAKISAMTPDGTHLVFRSEGTDGLTGYNQGNNCPGDATGSNNPACAEIYVYDATANNGAGALLCASCNPSGAPATADANIDASISKSVAAASTHLPHVVSDNGRYVFFNTGERLVPSEDVNGSVVDAYEFDTITHQVHLVSSGTSTDGSYFLDASADGHDVFFTTRDRLVGWDIDSSQDLYDARIGGGVPDPPPAASACSGDGCRSLSTGGLNVQRPGTATFVGPNSGRRHSVPVFHVVSLAAAQRRTWAATGHVMLSVRVSQGGRIRALVRARLGRHSVTVGRASIRLGSGGVAHLELRLSNAARAHLRQVGVLRLRIRVAYSRVSGFESMTTTLRSAASSSGSQHH